MERKGSIGKDATSKEMVKDLEEEQVPTTDDSEDIKVPSPDGDLDQPDELQGADPV